MSMKKNYNRRFNRGNRQDDTRNRNQGKLHELSRIEVLLTIPPYELHVQGLDTETKRAIVSMLRMDMNAVNRWVQVQEDVFPKQSCIATRIELIRGLTLVKTLLIDLELVLSRLERKSKHKN